MSFADELHNLPLDRLLEAGRESTSAAAERSLAEGPVSLEDFARLISPAAARCLPEMAARARQLTQRRFGRVIRLFAPLYLSNECVNNCRYCGFSRDNPILRVTLSVEEVMREGRALVAQGFRNLLLVAGEHPRFVSGRYLADCICALHAEVPSLSLEIGPLETAAYRPLVEAGAEGLVIYQETYEPAVYAEVHPSGPKRDFGRRLETPERAYAAGFRRLGIGALFGLADWRKEALCVAAHAAYLQRNCWKAFLTISLPRLRPCAGGFEPRTTMSDRELAQLVCALRLLFPDVGLVLSTRESSRLRDGLMPLGITLLSAGSHTEPGGYTGAGREKLHRTEKGRIVEAGASEWAPGEAASGGGATVQFNVADHRSAAQVAEQIRRAGYEPVWKDWDAALAGGATPGGGA